MAIPFLTNLDLTKNELQNAVVQNLSVAPASPKAGQIYFSTTDGQPYYYSGSGWVAMNALGATMTGASIIEAINNESTAKINQARLNLGVFSDTADGLVPKTGTPSGKFLKDDKTWATLPDTTVEIVDNLNDTSTTKALSANQGKVLDGKIGTAEASAKSYADTKAGLAETAAKQYTDTEIANLVGSSPEALDTLEELAAALGSDPNFATTVTNQLATKIDKYAANVGGATSQVITHNLNSRDVVVSVYENSSPYAEVYCDVERTSVDTVTLKFAKAPAANEYRVVITG